MREEGAGDAGGMAAGAQGGEGRGDQGQGERLQKVLARHGFGSRRACEELIAAGAVIVDGAVAVLGDRVDVTRSTVTVEGAPLNIRPETVYYLLNKPTGVVTTRSDPHGRPCVTELVPDDPPVFPVGRLDAATEGLLLLTNDGDLAYRLTHPSFGVDKEYLAEVAGTPGHAALRRLCQGVELDDGRTAPAQATAVSPGLVRIVVHEGRNRQVRRMCSAVGHPVRRLVRTRIGPITDHRLKPGEWRPLTRTEIRRLAAATAGEPARFAHGPK